MAVPTGYTGNLRRNEIFNVIFNMIISQRVMSKNVSSSYRTLVSRHREEGSMYGDTVLYYATDALYVEDFQVDTVNQLNLLATKRPPDPYCQAIVLDQFKFIQVTTDDYFSKRAWSSPNSFDEYKSQTLTWLGDTKDLYDESTYNTFIGRVKNANSDGENLQHQDIDYSNITPPSGTMDEEAFRRLVAETTAQRLDDIFVAMRDISREWNDLRFTKKLDTNDFDVVWNADVVNYLRNTGLPSLYHNDGLLKIKDENVLPAHYFAYLDSDVMIASAVGTVIDNTTYGMFAFKKNVKLGSDPNNKDVYWAGQFCPIGYTINGDDEYVVTAKFEDALAGNGECTICKLIHKDDIPYMSGYRTQREFINDKNLSKNHYLHFAHNTLQHIYNLPLVTVTTGYQPQP